MGNFKPFFSFLVRFHDWFDPLAKPWAKWIYLGWMIAAFSLINLGLWSSSLDHGAEPMADGGAAFALGGLGMLVFWFSTRYYWLYHTEILPKRAWSYHRRSDR